MIFDTKTRYLDNVLKSLSNSLPRVQQVSHYLLHLRSRHNLRNPCLSLEYQWIPTHDIATISHKHLAVQMFVFWVSGSERDGICWGKNVLKISYFLVWGISERGGKDRRTGNSEWNSLCVRGASHEFEDRLADGDHGGVVALDVLDGSQIHVDRGICETQLTVPSSNLPSQDDLGQHIMISGNWGDTDSTTSFTFGRAYAPSASISSQSSPATTVPLTLASYPSTVVRVPDFGSCFNSQTQFLLQI